MNLRPSVIAIRRIYEKTPEEKGTVRILVDRLWPRGLSKEAANLDLWAKEWAPSENLRHFFHEHPDRYKEFAPLYEKELELRKQEILDTLASFQKKTILLLYASIDSRKNNAVVLRDLLTRWLGQEKIQHAVS